VGRVRCARTGRRCLYGSVCIGLRAKLRAHRSYILLSRRKSTGTVTRGRAIKNKYDMRPVCGNAGKVRLDNGSRIDVHNVVVGDIVLFEPGEVIPCDGIFLSGHNVLASRTRSRSFPTTSVSHLGRSDSPSLILTVLLVTPRVPAARGGT